jgi:hypothetical protein
MSIFWCALFISLIFLISLLILSSTTISGVLNTFDELVLICCLLNSYPSPKRTLSRLYSYHIQLCSYFIFYHSAKNVKDIAHNVPAVYDVLPARIRALRSVAFAESASGAGRVATGVGRGGRHRLL